MIGKANDFQRRAFQSALASWKSSTNGELETDTLPMVAPTTVNDSALVLVRFGAEPAREDGVARFAAQELPPALAPGNRPPVFPPEARAINQEGQVRIAFVVDSTGVADVAAVQVLYASSPEFVGAVIAALRRDRFVPAMLNCRSVPVVVEQRFFFKISQ